MSVERVTAGLNLQSGDRFLVLYGTNTSDTFCTPDLVLFDIEQVLHQYLKSQGYQRILFYSGVKKLYFLDEESRDRCRLQPEETAASQPSQEMQLTSGPLGRKRGLLGRKSPAPSPPKPESHQGRGGNAAIGARSESNRRLQDVQILPIFQTAMQDNTQRSAIIFSNAEDLGHFDNRRELFGRMVEWSRLPPSNRNLCILIFHHENRTQLQQFCDRIGFTFLANLTMNRERTSQRVFNFVRLEAPAASEIRALRDYFRLKYSRAVNWSNSQQLSVWLAAEQRSLNYWYDHFQLANEISLTEARRQGWLSGDVSEQSALQRLEQMIGLRWVKEVIRRRMRSLEVQIDRSRHGQTTQPIRLHLVLA